MKNNRTRKNIRLKDYDYSSNGGYFITICTKDRECFFGEINNGKIELNNIGEMAQKIWEKIPEYFNFVELNEFIIMPNHIHGIIFIQSDGVGAISNRPSMRPSNNSPKSEFSSQIINHHHMENNKRAINNRPYGSISQIIKSYKQTVTKNIRNNSQFIDFSWQKSFHDRIIRNEKEHQSISEYILYNPENWQEDELYKKV